MKVLKSIGKVLGIILGSIVALFVIVILGLNLAKFAIYSEYYSIETEYCPNPGISDGFVQQGIASVDGSGLTLVCGYMKDKTQSSRIYVCDSNGVKHYVNLMNLKKPYTGHAGGLATDGQKIYLANGSKIYTMDLAEVLRSENGAEIQIGKGTPVNNNASFVFCDQEYLYVGEFNYGDSYKCSHPYQTKEGLHKAIVTKYSLSDLTTPLKIYSIRDKVQGIAFVDGYVVMSTSYGVADSVYYIYNEADAFDSGETLDGAKVYYLEECIKEFNGPAMGEDLDVHDGKIMTLTESASDKYIFGKFFFANDVVLLDFKKLLEE